MMLEVTPTQIVALSSTSLVDLMRRLLLAEAQQAGIPLSEVSVAMQITVPDGGEDGRVEWDGGATHTDFFPSRFCVFQSKASKLKASVFKSEVWKKGSGKKGKPIKPNDAPLEVATKGGSYILFTSAAMTGRGIHDGEAEIRKGFTLAGLAADNCAAIRIFDANKIANWVNQHISTTVWLHEQTPARDLGGLQSLTQWSKSPTISRSEWVDDKSPRFNIHWVETRQDLSPKDKEVVETFEDVSKRALLHLNKPQHILRIAGPSGFGKTRFAHALLSTAAGLAGAINANAVIFADHGLSEDQVNHLALSLADEGKDAIFVIDECPDAAHQKLQEIVGRDGSKLRLITIDIETHIRATLKTQVVRLAPASNALIEKIAGQCGQELSSGDIGFIKTLASGFPRMAVAAAEALKENREPLTSVEELLDRIIWGRKPQNEDAAKALEVASMFDVLGIAGKARASLVFVAEHLAGLQADDMLQHLMRFESRGVVLRRGDFIQVQPLPLAARLAARQLNVLEPDKLFDVFVLADESLRLSFLRRLRWLDSFEPARAFAQRLLSESNLGNLKALNTDFGSKCLDRLVHVDPDLTITTIDRVFGGMGQEDLATVGPGRRHLVWALERLVFRRSSFVSAATLLMHLAGAETEERIGNNATGQFLQLFKLHLSGTEAEPRLRLQVLDEGLRSKHPSIRSLCVDALGSMLERNHFSRSGGDESIGSTPPLRDWEPTAWDEVHDFYRQGLQRLTDIACSADEFAERAREFLGSHIRALLCPDLLDDVKTMIGRVIAHIGFWPEAILGVNTWLYFDRRRSPEDFSQVVRAYFDELFPTDTVDQVLLYSKFWPADLNDPDVNYQEGEGADDYEYSKRQAAALAESIAEDAELLKRAVTAILGARLESPEPFAVRLAEVISDPVDLFAKAILIAVEQTKPVNWRVLQGLLRGCDRRDPEMARTCLTMALKLDGVSVGPIEWVYCCALQESDLDSVYDLLVAGKIKAEDCDFLAYGQRLKGITPEALLEFLARVGATGANALWPILHILLLYMQGRGLLPCAMVERACAVMGDERLFKEAIPTRNTDYAYGQLFKLLDRRGLVDADFAKTMVRQSLVLTNSDTSLFFRFDHVTGEILARLVQLFPEVVWSELSTALASGDIEEHSLAGLCAPARDNYTHGGILAVLPPEIYLPWVREAPADRAPFVVSWLPILDRSGEQAAWHPVLQKMLAEFGDIPEVLSSIASRLVSGVFWGSMVPYLTPYLPLMQEWFNHPSRGVRAWSRQQHQWLKLQIDEARKRDEERTLGIF